MWFHISFWCCEQLICWIVIYCFKIQPVLIGIQRATATGFRDNGCCFSSVTLQWHLYTKGGFITGSPAWMLCWEGEGEEKVMSQAWRNTTEWEGDQACWPLCVSFLSIISQTDSSHNCFNRWSPGRRPSAFLNWPGHQKHFFECATFILFPLDTKCGLGR